MQAGGFVSGFFLQGRCVGTLGREVDLVVEEYTKRNGDGRRGKRREQVVMHQESGEHWARENQGPGLPILKTENRSPLFEIYAAFSTRLQISKLPERAGVGQSRSATGNCDDAYRSYGS